MPSLTTANKQEYLEALHHLQANEEPVSNSELAERLRVSPAAVSQMLKTLNGEGLVDYVPYRGASLTPEGRREAVETVRRHRLWERFLTDVLGMPWDQVHKEACQMEHVLSAEVVRRLEALLGHPETCPHGKPVPTAAGVRREPEVQALSMLRPPASAWVVSVNDEDAELLGYVWEIGLVPGAAVKVESREPFEGPLMLRVNGRPHAVGLRAAAQVFVTLSRKATAKQGGERSSKAGSAAG